MDVGVAVTGFVERKKTEERLGVLNITRGKCFEILKTALHYIDQRNALGIHSRKLFLYDVLPNGV